MDLLVARIETCGPLIRVESIAELAIARLVESSQVVPRLTDIRVEGDRPAVGVESVSILVNLIVQHTDTAPERGITGIAVDRLLV